MEKLYKLIDKYSRWQDLNLRATIVRIDSFIKIKFDTAIDNSKNLIETVCKTILDEQKVSYEKGIRINKLVKKTLGCMGVSNASSMIKFTNNLISVCSHIGELRNSIGALGHGHSLYQDESNPIEELTSKFLKESVESVVCFIIEYYEIEFPRKQKALLEQDSEFETFIDYEYGSFEIGNEEYWASEILYNVKPDAYQEALANFKNSEL